MMKSLSASLLLVFWLESFCSAHSYLKTILITDKTQNARILHLMFTSPIEVKFSKFSISQPHAKIFEAAKVLSAQQRTDHIEISLPKLKATKFLLKWNILSIDGHRQRGQREVKVKNGNASG